MVQRVRFYQDWPAINIYINDRLSPFETGSYFTLCPYSGLFEFATVTLFFLRSGGVNVLLMRCVNIVPCDTWRRRISRKEGLFTLNEGADDFTVSHERLNIRQKCSFSHSLLFIVNVPLSLQSNQNTIVFHHTNCLFTFSLLKLIRTHEISFRWSLSLSVNWP